MKKQRFNPCPTDCNIQLQSVKLGERKWIFKILDYDYRKMKNKVLMISRLFKSQTETFKAGMFEFNKAVKIRNKKLGYNPSRAFDKN
jgi:hypothetical protein